MYDNLFTPAPANATWQDPDKRFYTIHGNGPTDSGYTFGFKKDKHEWFPFPYKLIKSVREGTLFSSWSVFV